MGCPGRVKSGASLMTQISYWFGLVLDSDLELAHPYQSPRTSPATESENQLKRKLSANDISRLELAEDHDADGTRPRTWRRSAPPSLHCRRPRRRPIKQNTWSENTESRLSLHRIGGVTTGGRTARVGGWLARSRIGLRGFWRRQ